MDIDGWLRGIGLPQYAELFRANDIDGELLGRLTNDDLKDIGVASFGHRKRLLAAIAELGGAPVAAAASPPIVPAPIPATVVPPPILGSVEATGERRYLTVMFCDLVGSTGIAAKLDAEEWRDLVGGYLDAASAAVTEMGGHVAKKLGDGLLALFGFPLAQENDAERAARAALAIQRALADLNRNNAGSGKPALAARIGLDTGPAVIDSAGEIYGDVANVAARTQALAEPGSVLITAQVQRQIAGLFVVEERGSQPLKGVPEPIALYRLVRASGGGRRSGARQLTPLVGRDDEMTTLMRRWERARQGDGQLLLIVGEPGLGKSRLVEEFRSRLADTPHTWAEWSCSQLLQNTPLHPIAEWGRARFGGADVPAERRLADLESSLVQVKLDPAENAPLLAPLLDIPLPKERALSVASEELRRRQLAALTNWVFAGAKAQPVVLAFEDLHWADPTTLDVLRAIAERGAQVPLMIVSTTRPEFRPPWSMRSHHGTISLAPLDSAQVRDMVAELSARHALPQDVVDDVAARTGGVPLFVEEVTRLLLERGGESGIHAIPPTLQQSLMARLDRLGPAREVAQMGSVIGRGFSYALLRDVAGLEDAPLQAALEKLAEADILLVQGAPPESDYRFKHALIQDAAYENLLKSRRQVLHRRVAEILRDRFAATAAAEPEVLAHHFTQAGLTDSAIEWWGKAGDQALRRSAFQEAIAHLGKAIEMADKEGESALRAATASARQQRLKLQTDYGQAVLWSKGFGSQEAKTAFARAKELAERAENPDERFATYYGQWIGSALRGELGLARETLESFLREANEVGARAEAAVAHRVLGLTCLTQGEFTIAQQHLDEALRLYDPQHDRETNFRFGQDTGATARAYLAHTDWQFGNFQRMRELMEDAAARAVDSSHPPTLANVYHVNAALEAVRGDANATLRVAEMLGEVSQAHGLAVYLAFAPMFSGWARAWTGDRTAGLIEFQRAVAAYAGLGNKWYLPLFQGLLAELEADVSSAEQALSDVDAALALAGETGEHWTDSLLHRIRGEILSKRDPANTAPAEDAFFTAIAVAQQQKAKSFELRAALSLAKLYQSTGRPADAHTVLATALDGFSPTPEFPEIEQAQTVLATLAQADEVRNAAAARQRRLKLQTSYGQALLWSKGFAADETKAAFTRAKELAAGITDADERFPTYYGLWVGSLLRGELVLARETAETFLSDAKAEGRTTEAAVASRNLGQTCLYQGEVAQARAHYEEALRIYAPEHDRDSKFRFAHDHRAAATALLALTSWLLGDFARARELIEGALKVSIEASHQPTQANVCFIRALIETIRGDAATCKRNTETFIELSRDRGLALYSAFGAMTSSWARARLGEPEIGVIELRKALTSYTDQGNRLYVPLFEGRLAELEAEADGSEKALNRIDEALALAGKTGEHWTDAFLHHIRGEILLKRDPANTAPAEEAFLTAIAIAQQQKAKSFELRAALALAKLHRSTERPADAHAVLAPALEGFSLTPVFPEIAEAEALLAALAETDEVKNVAEARQRRLKLQTSYGQAMMLSRGFGAEETRAAFRQAQELAANVGNAAERFDTYYGLFVSGLLRGDLALARETAETFLREANSAALATEAGVANRNLGMTCLFQGNLVDAHKYLEEALRSYNPERDRDAKYRFGADPGTAAGYLSHVNWLLGDVERAQEMIKAAIECSVDSEHAPTVAYVHHIDATLGIMRRDAEATLRVAQAQVELSRQHQMGLYLSWGLQSSGWARAQLGDRENGLQELAQALEAHLAQGNKLFVPFFQGLRAEHEAQARIPDVAFNRIHEALVLAEETGEHWSDAFLHRIRGEILSKVDPSNTAPAEEAFLNAIAIARQQKARSFELQAAISLARLWRDQGKPQQARELLAPVYGWFTEDFDMPDLKEAKALLNELRA